MRYLPSIASCLIVCVACLLTTLVSGSPQFSPGTVPQNPSVKGDSQDTSSTTFDTPASYPGGPTAWMHYLVKNIHYPSNALSKNIQGQVIVQFTVTEKGRLKNIKSSSGPKELRQEAIRLINHSGRWNPALLKGVPVVSQREQAVTFKTE